MNLDKVNVAFIVDKSGSMTPFEESNYSGLNKFIDSLKTSHLNFSYFKYESEETVECANTVDIGTVKLDVFESVKESPNRCTKIHEHVKNSVELLERRYKNMGEVCPSLTIFVILSDGLQDVGNQKISSIESFSNFSNNYNSIVIYFGLEEETNKHAIDDFGASLWCYSNRMNVDNCYRVLSSTVDSLTVSENEFIKNSKVGFTEQNNSYAILNNFNPKDFEFEDNFVSNEE